MKWPKPKHGDKRRIKRFAFFPVEAWGEGTNKRYTVWLEHYISLEIYTYGFANLINLHWYATDKFIIE